MYPREFDVLWILKVTGDHARPACDIAGTLPLRPTRITNRSCVQYLLSLERRKFVERVLQPRGPLHWRLTDRGREVVAL